MEISLPFGRVAATAACLLLCSCAAGPQFETSATMRPPNPALGAFLAAHYAEAVNDQAQAAYYYARALNADPANQALREDGFMAGLLAGSGQAADIAPHLPGNTLAQLYLANEEITDGDYAKAITLFKTLPNDQLAHLIEPLLLAWAEFGQGHEQGALDLLRPNFDNGPFGVVYTLNAALIADAAGDRLRAAQLYSQIPTESPNLRLAQILSSWYAREGHIARADAVLDALVAAHPDFEIALPQLRHQMHEPVISTPAQGVAEAYLTLAASLSEPQAMFLRVVFLRLALEVQPDLSSARLILASTQMDNGAPDTPPTPIQIRNALATLAPIQPSDPLYSAAMLQKASLHAMLGETDKAVALLTQLLASAPNNPGLLAAVGDIRRDANQFARALPYYQQAISLLGTPPPETAWPLFFDLGICQDQTGDWQAAEPNIEEALKLSPNQPYVLNYLAYRWAQQGKNLAQAQDMLQRALSLDPNDSVVLDSLGYVELQRGNAAQALTLLTQAVQLAPQDAQINAHLGDAFALAGQNLQAVYQWDRALALGPDQGLKDTLTTRIQQTLRMMQP